MCFCFMAGNLQDNRYGDFAEAIKSGLREGVPYHVHRGEACLSYTNLRETQQRMNDALEYIEHLEKQNKDLQVRVDALSSKAALFDEAMIMGAKMERERDAAVADIPRACGYCKWFEINRGGNMTECHNPNGCRNISGINTGWEWRGAQKDGEEI